MDYPIHKLLNVLTLAAILIGGVPQIATSENNPMNLPQKLVALDEEVVEITNQHRACHEALLKLLEQNGDTVDDIVYSISPIWGVMLRASVYRSLQEGQVHRSIWVVWESEDNHIGVGNYALSDHPEGNLFESNEQ